MKGRTSLPILSAAAFDPSMVRLAMATRAPSSARPWASPKPRPLLAPRTSARFPFNPVSIRKTPLADLRALDALHKPFDLGNGFRAQLRPGLAQRIGRDDAAPLQHVFAHGEPHAGLRLVTHQRQV